MSGCATPSERFHRQARDAGFEKQIVPGSQFDHLVLTKNIVGAPDADLHVYIEGDGAAWIANRWIAKDPTPRKPVALELMQIDPGPALYLGRPCYFGLRRNCTPDDWTVGRYSEAVIEDMAKAFKSALDQLNVNRDLVLIGYSGGGVLAMLLAARIPRVQALVTLAANLDVGRWTRHHGYSPLWTSLNPATEVPLPAHIAQFHLYGGSDRNVPIVLARPAIDKQPNPTLLRYPDYDHNCCWTRAWPRILELLR